MMNDFLRRTWAEIDLDALTENYRAIRAVVSKESMMCCVVKADAYGHGAPTVARLYQQLGADWFAVSNLEEAVQLRRSGIRRPILILGYTPPEMAGMLMQEDIAQSVLSLEYARALSEQAQKARGRVRCHIKVDTGMSRIGFFYQQQGRDDHSLIEIEEA
ncbi:MAG: alanine racemase, partial [Acutalibacteraceae bacterium]